MHCSSTTHNRPTHGERKPWNEGPGPARRSGPRRPWRRVRLRRPRASSVPSGPYRAPVQAWPVALGPPPPGPPPVGARAWRAGDLRWYAGGLYRHPRRAPPGLVGAAARGGCSAPLSLGSGVGGYGGSPSGAPARLGYRGRPPAARAPRWAARPPHPCARRGVLVVWGGARAARSPAPLRGTWGKPEIIPPAARVK